MRIIVSVFLLVVILFALPAYAIPPFAALQGGECISCHANPHGGGLRNFVGKKELVGVGIAGWDRVGLGGAGGVTGSGDALVDGRLRLGADVRVQTARSHLSEDAARRVFPMQGALEAEFRVVSWLRVQGMVNPGPLKFDGQRRGTIAAVVSPGFLPMELRAGLLQPARGMRYDDHTLTVRRVPGGDPLQLIPPDYAEYGAEVSWDGFGNLLLTGGIYDSGALADQQVVNPDGALEPLIADTGGPSWLARAMYQPGGGGWVTGYAGASWYGLRDYGITEVFGGLGLDGRWWLLGDYTGSRRSGRRTTDAGFVELGCRVAAPLMVSIRGGRGVAATRIGAGDIRSYSNEIVLGAQVLLTPGVELRPEYRWQDTERYLSTRWACHLHIFR